MIKRICFSIILASVTGCDSHNLSNFSDNDLLKASLEADRLDVEASYMFGICYNLPPFGYLNEQDYIDMIDKLDRADEYYENVYSFKHRNSDFLDDYRDKSVTAENQDEFYQILESYTYVMPMEDVMDRFGVNNIEFDSSRYPPEVVSEVMDEIYYQKINYVKGCKNFANEVVDDKYFPNYKKYSKEYRLITGMPSVY